MRKKKSLMPAFDFKEADCYLWFFCSAVARFTASLYSLSDSSYFVVCLVISAVSFPPLRHDHTIFGILIRDCGS